MSWSFSIPSQPAAAFDPAVERDAYISRMQEAGHESGMQHTADQIDAALAAAKSIIDSGAVGSDNVLVSVLGHANPGHEPREGWADDSITVAVTYGRPAAAESPAPEGSDAGDGGQAATVASSAGAQLDDLPQV